MYCAVKLSIFWAAVALLAEGVDRNLNRGDVALLAEGVDRNIIVLTGLSQRCGRPPRGGRG